MSDLATILVTAVGAESAGAVTLAGLIVRRIRADRRARTGPPRPLRATAVRVEPVPGRIARPAGAVPAPRREPLAIGPAPVRPESLFQPVSEGS